MSIAMWFFKKRMEAYDEHLRECRERAVVTAHMDERLATVEGQISGIHSTVHWVGDCIVTVGARLDVKLPDRPSK